MERVHPPGSSQPPVTVLMPSSDLLDTCTCRNSHKDTHTHSIINNVSYFFKRKEVLSLISKL